MLFRSLLASLFIVSTLFSASSQYVGVILEGGYDWLKQEPSKVGNVEINPIVYGAKVNLGIDGGEDVRTNIFFGLQYFDKDIYEYKTDGANGRSNQFLYSVGFNIVKTYSEPRSSVLPYLSGGMDYEFIDLKGYAQGWGQNVGFSFGGGTFLRMSDTLEWQLGTYYKYRMWGNYNLNTQNTQNVELSDHSLNVELGLNFHY